MGSIGRRRDIRTQGSIPMVVQALQNSVQSSSAAPMRLLIATHTQNPSGRTGGPNPTASPAKQFKLISVDFKEAALDSPSFRATINHLDSQVDNVEKWLTALISTISKFPLYVTELKMFSESFLEHLLPTFSQDGLLQQEYTVQALQTINSGMHKLWDAALFALTLDTKILDKLKSVVENDVKAYKRLRKKFEQTQGKYDKYLAIYHSTPKVKDPNIVMEDAHQLFEVRKEYIHISIELSIMITTLGHTLDKVFVKLTSDIWDKNLQVFEKFNAYANFFQQLSYKVRRIQSWCDTNTVALEKLLPDMATARIQVESSANLQHQPSTNLDDYRTALLNNTTLQDIVEQSTEKHGYLFMKSWRNVRSRKSNSSEAENRDANDSGTNMNLTVSTNGNNGGNGSGNPNGNHAPVEKRQIWVKRWAFIKSGVFGLLNLSPSGTFVQESDKIGLLICNVKYAPYEDRRNCFEVKTIDSTYIFQCETTLELKSWLMVFHNEKNRILTAKDDPKLFNIASGRYPPILKELSNTINTVTDRLMTSSKIVSSVGQIITPSTLSKHIELNEKNFKKYVYYQLLQFNPPFSTDSTKSAILAYSMVEANNLPTAITANVCGSINWGLYYLHDFSKEAGAPLESPKSELSTDAEYENGYPAQYQLSMHLKDMQMRALFETGVSRDEFCLLSFRMMWSPNSRQELGGRCFVTSEHVYVYMNALGFISYYRGRIDQLVSIEYSKQPDFDLIRLYNLNGVVKMKLFLDDAATICKKMNYLIKNKVGERPDSLEQVMQKMKLFDLEASTAFANSAKTDYTFTNNETVVLNNGTKEPFPTIQSEPNKSSALSSSFNSVEENQVTTKAYRIDYTNESTFLASATYNLPPRAIFHALLGDNSLILNQIHSYVKLKNIVRKPWNTDPKTGKLYRKVNTAATCRNSPTVVQIEQRIDSMEGEDYFNFTHSKSKFKCPFTNLFKIVYRIVIFAEGKDKSRVLVYSNPVFDKELYFVSQFVKKNGARICLQEANSLLLSLKNAEMEIGNHGMTVKAIYIFGKLTRALYKDDTPDVLPTKLGFTTIMNLLTYRFSVFLLGYISQMVHLLANGIITFVKAIRMNQLLIVFLMISSLFNIFLVGKSTSSFWRTRQVAKMADTFLSSEDWTILKAIYVKDVEDMLKKESNMLNSTAKSRCFESFKTISFSLNHGRISSWESEYGDTQTREVAKTLKKSIQEIAIKRNELLVHLNMLNQMEEQVARGEWKNWLLNEIQRCDFIKNEVLTLTTNLQEFESGAESIIAYCDSCSEEWKHLELL